MRLTRQDVSRLSLPTQVPFDLSWVNVMTRVDGEELELLFHLLKRSLPLQFTVKTRLTLKNTERILSSLF